VNRTALGALGTLLVAAAFAADPSAVPIYDGVGFPDEPYRYVDVHQRTKGTAAPTGASGAAAVAGGRFPGLTVATEESGPQALVVVSGGAVAAAPGPLRVSVEPVAQAPDGGHGRRLGNFYRVTATDAAGAATELSGMVVSLRIPAATEEPVALELAGAAGWTRLQTRRTGRDVYSAFLPRTGVVASFGLGGSPSGGGTGRWWLLGALVAALATVVLLLRRQATSAGR
jgi:hypothetical protein